MKEFLWQHILSMAAMGTVCFTAGCLVCSSKLKDARTLAEINSRVDREAAAVLDAMDARKPLLSKPSAEAHIVHLQALAAFTVDAARTAVKRLGDPGPVWFTPTEWAAAMRSTGDNILRLPEFATDLLPRNAFLVRRLP